MEEQHARVTLRRLQASALTGLPFDNTLYIKVTVARAFIANCPFMLADTPSSPVEWELCCPERCMQLALPIHRKTAGAGLAILASPLVIRRCRIRRTACSIYTVCPTQQDRKKRFLADCDLRDRWFDTSASVHTTEVQVHNRWAFPTLSSSPKGPAEGKGYRKFPRSNSMQNIKQLTANLVQDESGQDLIEYALVAALIGLAAVSTMKTLATNINSAFNAISNNITNAV